MHLPGSLHFNDNPYVGKISSIHLDVRLYHSLDLNGCIGVYINQLVKMSIGNNGYGSTSIVMVTNRLQKRVGHGKIWKPNLPAG